MLKRFTLAMVALLATWVTPALCQFTPIPGGGSGGGGGGSLNPPGGNGILVYDGNTTLTNRTLTAAPGGGVVITDGDGVAANPEFAVDSTVVMFFASGSGAPNGSTPCGVAYGVIYTDTDNDNVYICTQSGTATWAQIGGGGGTGNMNITSGTATPGTCTAYVDWFYETDSGLTWQCSATDTWKIVLDNQHVTGSGLTVTQTSPTIVTPTITTGMTINPSGSTTMFSANPAAFTGSYIDFQLNGSPRVSMTAAGANIFNGPSGGSTTALAVRDNGVAALNYNSNTDFWTTWNTQATGASATTNVGVAYMRNTFGQTNSASDTSATNLVATPGAGVYRASVYCTVTTTEGGRVATATLSWTDAGGAKTLDVCTAVDLTAAAFEQMAPIIQIASGSPQIAVAYTGGSTGIMRVYVTLERIQ